MARTVRKGLGFHSEPVSNHRLGELFGVTEQALVHGLAPMAGVPLSLAVKAEDGDQVTLLFRRESRNGRRFEVARWIADALLSTPQDHWLPATDTKTARQKVQRAFAAEFLAPIDALQTFLGSDLVDEDRIEEAGGYFGVSPLTVRSHLVNHGLVPWDVVGAVDPRALPT